MILVGLFQLRIFNGSVVEEGSLTSDLMPVNSAVSELFFFYICQDCSSIVLKCSPNLLFKDNIHFL